MLVSQQGWLLPSALENSALSPFSLAQECCQSFFSGAVSSLISWDVLSGASLRHKQDWHDMAVRRGIVPLFLWSPAKWCSAGTGFTLMCTCCCTAPQAPKQAVHCSSVFLCPCPGGWWSSCIHWSPAVWLHIRTRPDKWEQLAQEHWGSPCGKSAVTSCVNETSLSNLCNINPKLMNKSKSAFLALVCRGAEDYEMLTGLGIEIRSFALVKAKNSLCFWMSLFAASMNFRERCYSERSS